MMRTSLFLALLLSLSLSAEAASTASRNFVHAPPLPSRAALETWGPDMAVEVLRGRELLREAAPLTLLDYPGKRDVYTRISEGEYDVTRVDTDVHIDLDEDGPLYVETRVTLVALEDAVTEMDFYLEFPELLELTAQPDVGLTWDKMGGLLKIDFAEPLPVEEEVVLTFRYQGELDCDVKFMLPTCKVAGAWKYVTHSQFLPYQGSFGEIFVGNMTLWIRGEGYEEWHAGGTGTYTGTVHHAAEGVKEIRFEHIFPTGLYAWSASKMTTVSSAIGDLPLSATVQHGQAGNMGNILGIVQDVIAFYDSVYVKYPWNVLDLVAMPKSFSGGFGPLSTIFVTQSILDASPDGNSYWGAVTLISHEIGHEWWGNLVEMADGTAIILSEGLAEFSSNRFFEHITGGSRWTFVDNNMTYTYTVPHDEEPIMISPYVYASPYYYQVAYQKGAAVIDMLRLEIGDEAVLDGLREMGERYYMEYAYPEELFEVFEEVSGQDLDYFYAQWLEGRGAIIMDVLADCAPGSAACTITLSQDSLGGQGKFEFNLPVRVELLDGTREDFVVRVDDWSKTFVLEVAPAAVRRIFLDPRRQLARIWRPAGPHGDIDLSGVVDGADLLEMSFAYQANLVVASDWGEFFYANPSYNELADVATNDEPGHLDGRINQADLDVLLSNF